MVKIWTRNMENEQEEKIEQNERDEEKLTNGKYKGKTFRDVRDSHPDYCEWVENKKGLKNSLKKFQAYLLDEEDEDTKYTFPPLRKHCNRVKVADHDHLLEKDNFLGAAHSYCNLQRQTRRTFITVICHNAANYDWHLLIRELIKKPYQIRPIAKTAYKFISFKFGIFPLH